jgi:predicted RNase H-like HicB family nuclease
MRKYIGVIRRDPDHGFAVTFPDLPGLVVFANSPDAAPAAAEQGLSKHLPEMHAAGDAIPAPSEPDMLIGAQENAPTIAVKVRRPARRMTSDPPRPDEAVDDNRGVRTAGPSVRLRKGT